MAKVKIDISKNGKRIELRSTVKIKGLQKKIPGANFARTGGAHWTMPLNMETCKLLREKFGKRLEIGPDLRAWAVAKRDRARKMAELGKADSAELPGLWLSANPKLWKALVKGRKYQSAGARFIAEGRRVIVSDEVGLGKTAQTLGGILESQVKGPYLIVCPKSAVSMTWGPEIRTWLPDYNAIEVTGPGTKRHETLKQFVDWPSERDFVIVNQEMLRTRAYWLCMNWIDDPESKKGRKRCGEATFVKTGKKELDCKHDPTKTKLQVEHDYPELFDIKWGAIVADESHKCLLKKSKRPTQTRLGMEKLSIVEDGLKIAQSATPWRSRPHLLWATLNWLYPEEYTAFWSWVEIMYEVEEAYADGPKVIGDLDEDREDLLYESLNTIMIRRTRREVAKDLPQRLYIGTHHDPQDEGTPHGIWLPIRGKQWKAYREMEESAEAMVEGGELTAIGSLAELTRLRQLATCYGKIAPDGSYHPALPSNKFDYLVDLLEELGFPDDPTTKVIVVSSFTEVLELFAKELRDTHGIESLQLTGKTTDKERRRIKRIFNDADESPHLLFLNTIAGGTAITLDAADEMVFLDESPVADDQEQVEGRNDNRRPEEKIVQRRYRYLRSLDSVEVGIAYSNLEAASQDRRLLDGRRGVEYFIEVMEQKYRQDKTSG